MGKDINLRKNEEEVEQMNSMEKNKSFLTKKDLFTLVTAILFTILIRVFIIDIAVVEGSSMEGTIHDGDRVIYSKMGAEPVSGEIGIVDAGEHVLIKRIIATEGESIEIKEGSVYINDVLLKEDYLDEVPNAEEYPRTVLKEGEFFAMGDNRNHSSDSRVYGVFKKEEHYKGHVLIRFNFFETLEKM